MKQLGVKKETPSCSWMSLQNNQIGIAFFIRKFKLG